MLLLTILLFILSLVDSHLNLGPLLKELSCPLHHFCLELVPAEQVHRDLSQALLCGRDLDHSLKRQLILDSGLYHVLVVSGAHLIFLAQVLSFLPRKLRPLTFPALAAYTLMCQAAPPVTRAFVGLILGELNSRCQWQWGAALRSLMATLLCLVLFPSWIESASFMMSACAAMALGICRGRPSPTVALVVLVFMAPLLMTAMNLQPLPWILNFTLAELMAFFMLPIVTLSTVAPLPMLVDWLWQKQLDLLDHLSPLLLSQKVPVQRVQPFLYILAIHWIWILAHLIRRRFQR